MEMLGMRLMLRSHPSGNYFRLKNIKARLLGSKLVFLLCYASFEDSFRTKRAAIECALKVKQVKS